LRLDAIVWVYRAASALDRSGGKLLLKVPLGPGDGSLVLVDRYGASLQIPGPEPGLARLLAEILSRVPGAVNGFDHAPEWAPDEGADQVIAAADRERIK